MIHSTHVATKETAFGNIPVFLFLLSFGKEKPRRTVFFQAEHSAEKAAVSAKDSAASDAEPFAVAGTVPYIRQLPRSERRGW